MPAVSEAQRRAIAIAEHHPEKLHAENKGLLSMTHKQMHEFASTPETHLPHHVHHDGNPSYEHARNARRS